MKQLVTFFLLFALQLNLKSQNFTHSSFVGCGLNYEILTSRTSLRASNGFTAYPRDTFPLEFDISIFQTNRELLNAYILMSISGTDTSFAMKFNTADTNTYTLSPSAVEAGTDPCWNYPGKYLITYDVSDMITTNGKYTVDSVPLAESISSTDTDGLALLLVYTDPYEPQVGRLYFSKGVRAVDHNSKTVSIPNLKVNETVTAKGFILASDLQSNGGNTISINGSPGYSITEDFWDYETKSTAVVAGQTSSLFSMTCNNDCAHLLGIGLHFEQSYNFSEPTIVRYGDTLLVPFSLNHFWYLNDSLLQTNDSFLVVNYPADYQVILADTIGCMRLSNVETVTCFNDFNLTLKVIDRDLMVDTFYSSIEWYKNDTLQPTVTGFVNQAYDSGRYYAIVVDSLGCQYQSNEHTFLTTTSILDLFDDESLTVYPNPNKGEFEVILSNSKGFINQMNLYTIQGKLVYQENFGNAVKSTKVTTTIDEGVYVLDIKTSDQEQIRQKIVIRK